MPDNEVEALRYAARYAGLIAGAVYRGDVWPTGTLVRWKGKASKVTYRITGIRTTGHRTAPPLSFDVQLTPLQPGPVRSVFWTGCEYLREVSE